MKCIKMVCIGLIFGLQRCAIFPDTLQSIGKDLKHILTHIFYAKYNEFKRCHLTIQNMFSVKMI